MRLPVLTTILIAAGTAAGQAFAQEVPENLTNIGVDRTILDTVDRQLPEAEAVGAEFLNESYYPSLRLDAASHLSVTFVSEGAGYRNAVGYFTYQDGAFDNYSFSDFDMNGSGNISYSEMAGSGAVDEIGVLFGNFSAAGSGGSLTAGDTTVIGGGGISLNGDGSWLMDGGTVFDAGTNVGFFLIANGWNGSGVNGVDNLADNATYWSMDFLNPENDPDATIEDVSRDTRHLAMLNVSDANQIVVGFEDLNRATGDNDFNDAVFIVRSDPAEALQNSNIPKVSAAPAPGLGAGAGGLILAGGLLAAARRRRKSGS
ncbi:MAG: DUF4114 domain-containing protein [Minwuia sp.]|uniref:DUF4114 domain-containing protein n=1 Tax=Minwuia sp. TaxID=2493630 RepID=UPI003A85589C